MWYTQVKRDVFGVTLGCNHTAQIENMIHHGWNRSIEPTTFKASSHERCLLRFAARFSPFEGCEKFDEFQMFQVMIFHNNTISNPLFHILQKES